MSPVHSRTDGVSKSKAIRGPRAAAGIDCCICNSESPLLLQMQNALFEERALTPEIPT